MIGIESGLRDKYIVLQEICFRKWGPPLWHFPEVLIVPLVLKIAFDTLGTYAKAVTAVSPTFPAIELEGVYRLSSEIGVTLHVVETDQLAIEEFVRNDEMRCFHCKTDLYQLLGQVKADSQANVIVDGTNIDDLQDDRPGIMAAKALGVRSPLVEAGLGKVEIRALAKALGLSNWEKPAAACLSSRIPRGIPITRGGLSRIEQAEALLFREGLKQVRVRDHEGVARIETTDAESALFHDAERRYRIVKQFKQLGFRFVTLDLEGYRPGSTNSIQKAK